MVQPAEVLLARQESAERWTPACAGVTPFWLIKGNQSVNQRLWAFAGVTIAGKGCVSIVSPLKGLRTVQKIGVIGAGAWGTALAVTLGRAGREVVLWGREAETIATLNQRHENPDYLPGLALDPCPVCTTDPAVVMKAEAVLVVVPAQFVRETLRRFAPLWPVGVPAVLCAKGVERETLALMSEIAAETLPGGTPLAVLSGPTFAAEVARGQPSAVTLACEDGALGERLVAAIGTRTFRPYLSPDVIGAEVAGAVKNVLAIACGVVEGRGFGDNARAALITRGLAEITRLGVAKGGRAETFMGLSGMGDLILTATSMQSRNFSLGYALGQGQSLEAVLGPRKAVTEGVFSAAAVVNLAASLGVEMPICAAVDALINQGLPLESVIEGLLSRPFRSEYDL